MANYILMKIEFPFVTGKFWIWYSDSYRYWNWAVFL